MSLYDLIVNGNFETGSLIPWTTYDTIITSQYSHSGVFSAQFPAGPSFSFLYQFVPATPGQRLEFLVSLGKIGDEPSPQIDLIILYADSFLTYIEPGLLLILPQDFLPEANERNWIEVYKTTAPVPPGATQALVFISKQFQSGTAGICIDDISLLEVLDGSEAIGATGATGETGPTGATGAAGATGATGTVIVGKQTAFKHNISSIEHRVKIPVS